MNLDPEKQERILNAAIKEFSQKGYANASTNEIVKEANISKGLLFHYFNKKKDLFLFLYDYFVEIIANEFFEKLDQNEKDIFIKLRQIMLLKLELIKKYPHIFNFIISAYVEDSSEVKNDLNITNKEFITNSYNKLFKDIDISSFKEGIDIKRAINIITWVGEGFRNQELEKIKLPLSLQNSYEESFAEIDLYMDILKKALYK